MVAIGSLNLDVLELISSFLPVNDLYAVALVNHAFYDGVISRLYRSISYRLRHAKCYESGSVMSPFAVLTARRSLAVHVHQIEIRTIPTVKEKLNPKFMKEANEAITLCTNLRMFKCAARSALPMFIPSLSGKPLLNDLRVAANLTTEQTATLSQHSKLQTLTLQWASWNVVDALPSWSARLQHTLTTLTLYMILDVQETILKTVLTNLTNLTGLHIVGCPRVDHLDTLRLLAYAPYLESLSLTVSDNVQPPDALNHPMPSLKHLALDCRNSASPNTTPAIMGGLMRYIKTTTAPLASLVFKLAERSLSISDEFIATISLNHGETLRRVAFVDCTISTNAVAEICTSCPRLDRLELSIPMKELSAFAHSVALSGTLNTIVDIENHVEHGLRQSIGHENARLIMLHCPSLKKIVSAEKIWTGRRRHPSRELQITVEKRHSHSHGSLWFMPVARND